MIGHRIERPPHPWRLFFGIHCAAMRRTRTIFAAGAIVAATAVAAGCTAASGGDRGASGSSHPSAATSASPVPGSKLKHLIFIVQENRSFDHYFGTYPGADGIPTKPDG